MLGSNRKLIELTLFTEMPLKHLISVYIMVRYAFSAFSTTSIRIHLFSSLFLPLSAFRPLPSILNRITLTTVELNILTAPKVSTCEIELPPFHPATRAHK